jgi:hypothetical protein
VLEQEPKATAATPADNPTKVAAAPEMPALLPLISLRELFDWYELNLCGKELTDPRGYRVFFQDTDFVHLIKLRDKYNDYRANPVRAHHPSPWPAGHTASHRT